jgi:hypothetical protein
MLSGYKWSVCNLRYVISAEARDFDLQAWMASAATSQVRHERPAGDVHQTMSLTKPSVDHRRDTRRPQ